MSVGALRTITADINQIGINTYIVTYLHNIHNVHTLYTNTIPYIQQSDSNIIFTS
jgi:hypothetical protein